MDFCNPWAFGRFRLGLVSSGRTDSFVKKFDLSLPSSAATSVPPGMMRRNRGGICAADHPGRRRWVGVCERHSRRSVDGKRAVNPELNALYRVINTRLIQRKRRERLNRAVDIAVKKRLIENDFIVRRAMHGDVSRHGSYGDSLCLRTLRSKRRVEGYRLKSVSNC